MSKRDMIKKAAVQARSQGKKIKVEGEEPSKKEESKKK